MFKNFNSIYLDFDGTITKYDTLGLFFSNFAGPGWLDAEQEWISGKINSKTCVQRQLALVKNLTPERFYDFLNSIEIQDGFIDFCAAAKKAGKKITVLSDGFDFFISYTLKRAGLDYIDFYSNKLNVTEKNGILEFSLEFPNENRDCKAGLGSCKCSKLSKNIKDEKFIYAGDGLSDWCIASKSKMLFAKKSLKKHCEKNGIKFIEFKTFFNVLDYLKEGMANNAGFTTKNIDRK